MARCARIKDNGERCKADAMPGAEWCYSHDPERAEERKRNASKGGKRGGRGRPQAELADIKGRLRAMIEDVRSGAMDRADAAVCGQLYNTLIRALSVELKVREVEDLERRMEELEAMLERQNKSRGYGA